jgi:DNA (cytosine-5)-methyltransferase 1
LRIMNKKAKLESTGQDVPSRLERCEPLKDQSECYDPNEKLDGGSQIAAHLSFEDWSARLERARVGTKPPYTMVSLFAGVGGIDLGFESTGAFRSVLAVDWSDYCIQTLEANQRKNHTVEVGFLTPWLRTHPRRSRTVRLLDGTIINKMDLSEASGDEIRRLYPGAVDVLTGGPPCQPFSVRNRSSARGLLDAQGRGNLVFSFMRLVDELRPRAFLFENVMGLERDEHGDLLSQLLAYAEQRLGYQTTVHKVVASRYGVPQDRRRIIIVGFSTPTQYSPPTETHGQAGLWDSSDRLPMVTVRKAIEGLPEPGSCDFPANHKAPKHSEEMMMRFSLIMPGKQDPVRKKIRLHPDRPCPAIFSGSDTGGGLADLHPIENRALTPRECARLQSLPDFWELVSNRSGEMYKMVANAVPPTLAAAFASAIATSLDGGDTY